MSHSLSKGEEKVLLEIEYSLQYRPIDSLHFLTGSALTEGGNLPVHGIMIGHAHSLVSLR